MSGSGGFEAGPNDIAIVGMALRVPGARTVDAFWSNLVEGVESIRDLTDEELLAAGESEERLRHPRYVRRAAELPDMEMFDADFFGMSPKEAAIMDPQHRQFLECAWEAMEDAGRMPDTAAGPVGVFAGCGMGSYFYFNVCSNRQLVDQVGMFLLRHTGNDKDFLATRASFLFDLRGPSVNVQTACSTSLVAVHSACQSLLAGECETALAGGVTIELPHRLGYIQQEGEILSPDGRCRPFDHRAAGTVFGSGAGVVVLRRLSDALADGDPIHAVIKATAVNNDGATKAGYLAPSASGQAEAIIEAQGLAGISADTIGYVECHGTGTYLGDPIEVEALTEAFRQSTSRTGFCRIGSVKSNIGHLDTAAGVVSLIKAALCVKTGQIPPTLGFEKPNPAIPFETSPFRVADRLAQWDVPSAPRRAAVNSLGVGGTNAHAVIEQAPNVQVPMPGRAEGPELLLLSAKSRAGLDLASTRLANALESRPDPSLTDAAYTLVAGRRLFEHRRVVAAGNRSDAIESLTGRRKGLAFTQAAIADAGEPVFLFPGGGAQHVGMARSLMAGDPAVRATIDEGLSALEPEAAAEIRAAWFADGAARPHAEQAFLRPSLQLPAILLVEVAVARWWMTRGLRPAALLGHSMGENAAACIAGVLSLRDAVRLVRLRGELFETVEPGGMLSVSLGRDALADILPPTLDVASQNAPDLCVVSGRNEDLEAFAAVLEASGVETRRVAIDIAAHSRMLDAILPRFEAFLRSIRLSAPTIPILSNVSGGWLSAADATDPRYWVRHLRSTVEFGRGLALLAERAGRIFVEVGPGRALSSLAKLQPSISADQVINSLPHADDPTNDALHLLAGFGRAYAAGLDLPIRRLFDGRAARRVSLPTYPFQKQRYFIERAAPTRADEADAALSRLPDMAAWGHRPSWRRSAPALAMSAPGAAADPTSFLVFLDRYGFGAPIVDMLRRDGHAVATVTLGDVFARHDADAFALAPEEGRAGYDALVSALGSRGPLPSRILHLWQVTRGEVPADRIKEEGFRSLVHLAQALGDAAGGGASFALTVVANGMQRVGDEPLAHPDKALGLGPALVMPKEMPGVTVRFLDVQPSFARRRDRFGMPGDADTELRGRIVEELFAEPGNEVVAYRGEKRWTRGLESLPLMPAADERQPLRRNGTYLITGGCGDLGLCIGEALCERFEARLVLVGRTALPPRDDWDAEILARRGGDRLRRTMERILALEAAGHEVRIERGDVADADDMARVLDAARAAFGPIHGVFHAAGSVDDGLLATKSDAAMDRVLAPKVEGTRVLDRLLKDEPLDLFVLFSSTSTDTAPAGQADYVAANAFLNAYAEAASASDPRRRTVAIHWGVWNEIGLAARTVGIDARGSADARPAKGPFFERWVEDGEGVSWLEAELSAADRWLLDEHRMVSGEPVMPGTGYVEIIAQLLSEYGFSASMAIEDLLFLRPLLVPDGVVRRLRARIAARIEGGYEITVAANEGEGADAFDVVAEARLSRAEATAPAALDLAAIRAQLGQPRRAQGGEALRSVQEDHVRFGPRWRVLTSIAATGREAVADLRLSEAFHGDGAILHPAVLDIATGFALALAPGYGTGSVLWAPMSYGRIRFRGPLPARVVSWARLVSDGLGEDYASFDVTITDEAGAVLVEIERFTMRRLESDRAFAEGSAPSRAATPSARAASPQTREALRLEAQVRQGIRPSEGFELLCRALATNEPQPVVSSLDIGRLVAEAAWSAPMTARDSVVQFDRPELETAFVEPRTEVERILSGFWSELLGIEGIGVDDDFFDLGGHSLVAVRLFRMIRKTFGIDLPISVLYEAPTIAGCATLIGPVDGVTTAEDAAPIRPTTDRPTHLVAMQAGPAAGGTPFFLCAGMFGNVLNLRQLAIHLGADRPVYGLQARGLLDGDEPHETFEDMARSNLAEVRAVQPHGPYLLGGFSGGGLTALEMARQLRAENEEVALLVMLDTPFPATTRLDLVDRVYMKVQDVRRDGRQAVRRWRESRATWASALRDKHLAETGAAGAEQLRSARIEAAFRAALPRYTVEPYDGRVLLLRPKLHVLYRLRGGRRLQYGRTPASEDNGWGPFLSRFLVREVPGDHDGMVLEPFVHVLANRLRPALRAAEGEAGRLKSHPSSIFGVAAE